RQSAEILRAGGADEAGGRGREDRRPGARGGDHVQLARRGVLPVRPLARALGHGGRRRPDQPVAAPYRHPAVADGAGGGGGRALGARCNDVWTGPGEESSMARWQSEDREVFASADYHERQDRDFLRAAIEGRAPSVTAAEGRAVVEVIQAIYGSGRDVI